MKTKKTTEASGDQRVPHGLPSHGFQLGKHRSAMQAGSADIIIERILGAVMVVNRPLSDLN